MMRNFVLTLIAILFFLAIPASSQTKLTKDFVLDSVNFDADTVKLSLDQYIICGLNRDPTLIEKRFSEYFKQLKIHEIKTGVILPKFELMMGWGVTPGYKEQIRFGDTLEVYDFTQYGPAYIVDFKFAQPLNLIQRKWGVSAAEYDYKIKKEELKKTDINKSIELFEYYNGMLLAKEMFKVAKDAENRFNDALDQIEELLDEDDESVSQFDFLELKASMYELDKNVLDAENGIFRANMASKMILDLNSNQEFSPLDSSLEETRILIPSKDSLVQLLAIHHPDLKRLNYGLKANENLVALANAQLGPQIVVTGGFGWGNSWVGKRLDATKISFLQDPVEDLNVTLGIGIRYKLNIWNSYQKVRKAKAKYRELKLKENYAAKGLMMTMEDAYAKMEMHKKRMKSAYRSLRATESWLKGAAMQYDLDKSKSKVLIKAYTANIMAKKNYFYAVYNYNNAVAKLWGTVGLKVTDVGTL